MSAQFSTPTDELLLLAETLGEVKSRTEKLETEFSTQARPLEAATNALSAALSGIKALQYHVLDNNLGALSARVEEMRKAVDEQVAVIALELKKADETNAAKAGAQAETLRFEILALESKLESLVTQFGQQLERVEFAAKEEAKKLQLIPGPAGAAGASLNPRGTFIDGETYNRLDVVSWLGSSYIATVDGVTEKPSKNSNQWQTLASRGGGGAGGVGDFGSLAGVAQINQGGTGQTTRAAALNALLPDQAGSTQYMLLTDGSGTVSWGAQPVAGLPSQTSNSGRLLTTNGTTASWSNAVTVSGSNATVGGTLTVSGASGGSFIGDGGAAVASRQLTVRSINGSAFRTVASFVNDITGTGAFTGVELLSDGVTGALAAYGPTYSTAAYANGITLANGNTNGLVVLSAQGTGGSIRFIQNSFGNEIARFSPTNGNLLIGGTTDISGSGGLKVFGTTASTTTSSGALVVSGGVGVAGAIYAGGDVVSTGSGAQEIVCESTTAGNYAGVISKNNSGNTFNLYSLGSTYGGTVFGGATGNNQAVLEGSASISSICISHANPTGKIIIAPNRTNVLMVENSLVTVASGVDLKLGNAYTAGAPTATGYIVIKDSTGTSYKIPAVAL